MSIKRFLLLASFFLAFAAPSHALSVSDIITRVRLNVKDQATAVNNRQQFSDSQILSFINDGQREANILCWIQQSRVTFNLSAGIREYNLPSDFIATTRVIFNNIKIPQTSLNELDSGSLGWQTSTNLTPTSYYIYRSTTMTIGFVPLPSSTTVAAVSVDYLQQPSELTLTSQTPWNGYNNFYPYQTALVYYASYRCYRVLEEDLADKYYAEWTNELGVIQKNSTYMPDYNPGFIGQRK